MTSALDLTNCGAFTYDATYEGLSLEGASLPPIAYDSSTREFSVFSEDISLVGLKTITVSGYYENFSTNFF